MSSRLTLAAEDDHQAPFTLTGVDGSPTMVRAQPDDRSVDPAGERIACGFLVPDSG